MRRRVFHDASAAAVAAASLLGDDFDVQPWPVDALPEALAGEPATCPPGRAAAHAHALPGGCVVLAGGVGTVTPGAELRVIGVVDVPAHDWPDDWYAVLPEKPASATLVRAVRAAFADLDAAADIARLGVELAELNAVGIRLSAERDPHALLEMILRKAREITQSDAGSLYLVEDGGDGTRRLRFALAQNDSVSVPFQTTTLPLSRESLAGWVALEGLPLNIADAYALPVDAPFQINRSFDAATGYRTKSMLVVPMQTPQAEIIGAVQLINCKPAFAMRLGSAEDIEHAVIPFSARFVALASSLASQAAVALANSRLYESIRQLFDGFVQASVVAIESRDPTTAGHSFRVADFTVALAEATDRCGRGPYANFRLAPDDAMELRYASLLHDFGKVGVREHVLVKAKKLAPEALDAIRHRAERLKLSLELRAARRKLQYVLDKGAAHDEAHAAMLDAELAAALAEVDDALARVVRANEPSVVAGDASADAQRLAGHLFEDHLGRREALITPDEAEVLSIARGSLTPDEYRQIRAHVTHTWEFLVQIPWTREFRRIPDIAHAHHEKLNGTGYPRGLTASDIPAQSRMMAIADIYDALTAFDRPYKPAVSAEHALDILTSEQRAGALDGDLLAIFIEARVFARQPKPHRDVEAR